jgi:hypothetical protein
MQRSSSRHEGPSAAAGHLALRLACASLAGACSAYYPLGETSPAEELVESPGPHRLQTPVRT